MIETNRRSLFAGALAFMLVPMLPKIPAIAAFDPQVERYNSYIKLLIKKLEGDIHQLLSYSVFEPNDEYTRWQVQNIISMYLRDFQVLGSRVEEIGNTFLHEWRVVCDKSNNPPEIIDTCRLCVDMYVKPSKTVEFIHLKGLVHTSDIMGRVVTKEEFKDAWDVDTATYGRLQTTTRKSSVTPLSEEHLNKFDREVKREYLLNKWTPNPISEERVQLLTELIKI